MDMFELPNEFGCRFCAGTGYQDYPMKEKPCPIPEHVRRAEENEVAIRSIFAAFAASKRWELEDGRCPYCGLERECRHWRGVGWQRDA